MGDMNMVCAVLNQQQQQQNINQRIIAIQTLVRGNAEENAGAIFEVIATRPELNDAEAAAAVQSLLRRERGGCVFTGQTTRRNGKPRRVAPVVEITAYEIDETYGFKAMTIDFTEPDTAISAREIARFATTQKGQDLIRRAEPLVNELDLLRAESGEAIANDNDLCRRQGFYIKERRKEYLENTLARLRAHFEWCLENGVSEIAMESETESAQEFFDRATQTGFDFGGEGE